METTLKAIIVDDESFARDDLRYLLRKYPWIEIVGEASNVEESIALLSTTAADVVFLDIQLRGGTGFDVVPHIPGSMGIIFFTAYDAYAVRAFEVNALDYLMKPVTEDRLAESLRRLSGRPENRTNPAVPGQSFRSDDQVFIKTDSERRFIPVKAIVTVTSIGGNYSAIHLDDGKKYIVRRTLKAWLHALPGFLFFRIHRMAIANLEQIDHLGKERDGSYFIFPVGQRDPLKVSRRAAPLLKNLLEKTA